MDLVDGYHQMPLKKEHQHYTCTTTPQGVVPWTVLVMGLKSAGSQFQRMNEWVLKDTPQAAVYLDDIVVGSQGTTVEELIENHTRDLFEVLEAFEKHQIMLNPAKSKFFQQEIEFLGHILRDGVRTPSPGKLLPVQKWVLPRTVTELRNFLGITNYFSEYFPNMHIRPPPSPPN